MLKKYLICVGFCRIFGGQRIQMVHSINSISLTRGGWSLTSRVLCDSICDVAHPPLLIRNVAMSTDPYFLEENFCISDGRLPRSQGVYAVVVTPKWEMDSTPIVVYIGSSNDIYERFRRGGRREHIFGRLKSLLKSYVVGIYYREIRDHYKAEVALIKKYRPRFNKQHTNG